MKAEEKKFFPLFLLTVAIFIGLIVRIIPEALAKVPINDGGLFYQMVLDLESNSYRLPLFTSYNHAMIPYVYPPLGFYLTGGVHLLTKIDLYQIFRFWPGLASTLSIPAFYFLALGLLEDKMRAALAACFYAAAPVSFYLPFMGGGITRSPGLVFSLLALGFLYRMFKTRDRKHILPAAIFTALTLLSHPEIIFHTVFSAVLFWAMVGRDRRSFGLGLIMAGLTTAFTAPWWLLMLQRHGIGPFLTALTGNVHDALAILYLIQFNLTGEGLLTVIGVLSAIGLLMAIHQRQWLLPAWILLSFITSWRASPFSAIFPVSMLASIGLESLMGMTHPPFDELFNSSAKRSALMLLLVYIMMAGAWTGTGIALEQRLVPGELAALSQVPQLTSPGSRFLILTGAPGPNDPLSEWFPALTNRTSVATIQGHEWTKSMNMTQAFVRNQELQACLETGLECMENWSQKYKEQFDYIYIRKIRTLPTGGIQNISSVLENQLRQSGDYRIEAETNFGVIFKPLSSP